MYTVSKIDWCRTIRQILDISLWGKTINTVCKQIQVILQKTHELSIVRHILLPFQNLTEPVELFFLTLVNRHLAIRRFLVFPVGCDTVLCCLMHLKCTNLNLKRLSIRSNQCSMQRLVHIWLRHGNVIFKSAWDWLIHLVDDTKSCITVLDCIYQNTDSEQIINLIDCLVLINHLLINTEKVLDSSVNLRLDGRFIHMLFDLLDNIIDKFLSFTLTKCYFINQIIIYIRLEIFKRKVIQFYFNFGNTKSHSNRSINIHCLACLFLLFLRAHILKSSHIVKAVSKFDQNNTDILCHCKKHLSKVLGLEFYFVCRIT